MQHKLEAKFLEANYCGVFRVDKYLVECFSIDQGY